MWSELFNLGICFFEGYMYFFFFDHFLKRRSDKKWIMMVAVGILMTGVFAVNQLGIAGLNFLFSMVVAFILCQSLFVSPIKKKVFYVLLCCFIMLCCEFVMMLIFNPPLGNETIEIVSDPKNMLMLVLSSKLLTFMVIRTICHVSGNGKAMFFPSLAPYFCCFPIACLVVYVGITYSDLSFTDAKYTTIILEVGCVLLLIANIILFIVYDRMIYIMNRVKEYELTDIKRHLENQHYLQIEEINRKHSEIIHDMGNYLKTIERLAVKENNNKIIEIIKSLNQHIIQVGEEHYCNHQILNAILNGKKQEAAAKGVEYSVYVELGFEKPNVEDIDLISIMSNLIDNAIEAACKCDDGNVDVQLYKANDGRFTMIKIINNYKEKPVERDGEFVSRKQNPTMHGIGIRHVRSLVESYGGWSDIEYGEDKFCVTLVFA